jgi:hypothetical protein
MVCQSYRSNFEAKRDCCAARASFERNFFDFVETSQDPDVHRTTSTVTAFYQDLEPITRECHSSNELSASQNPQLQQG